MAEHNRAALARLQMLVNRSCAMLSGVAMLAMMLAGAADVIMTNLDMIGLASRPIPGVHEFIATMMVVAVFLAVSLAQARRSHIQVDIFTRLMPQGVQAALAALQSLLAVIVFGLIAWFGWVRAAQAYSVGEFSAGLFDFPVWPARIVLALGAMLMTLQCLLDICATLSPRYRTDDGTAGVDAAVH